MKIKLLLTILLAFYSLSINAQSPSLNFAIGIGSIGAEEGNALATDLLGNVYVTGKFSDTADFDPSPAVANLISAGYCNAFVAKYNSSGQYQWAFSLGDYWCDKGLGINVDMSGNIYVTGLFTDTVDFNPSVATANLISSNDYEDIFIAKYNSSGQYLWAIKMGSLYYDKAIAITTDNSNNVYVTGEFTDIADFDPSVATANLTSVGASDIFLAKYNSSGQYLWAIGMGGLNNESGNSLSVDAAGSVYITGSFNSSVDFDPSVSTANLVSAGGYDIFAAKYDSIGQYQWAFSVGTASSVWEEGQGIKADNFGNVYVTGRFQGTNVDFDPSIGSATLTSLGAFWEDIFIAKYSANGLYQWAINMGGIDSDMAHAITTDASGDIYITGVFNLTADFDPGSGSADLTALGPDIFVAKYDFNGQYQWAFNVGGFGWDIGQDICTDGSGNIYVTGNFEGTSDFDPSAAVTNLTSVGQPDFFIARYSQSLMTISQTENFLEPLIYPIPCQYSATIQFSEKIHNASFVLCNSLGQTVKNIDNINDDKIKIERDNLPSGIYFIRVTQDNVIISMGKLIIAD